MPRADADDLAGDVKPGEVLAAERRGWVGRGIFFVALVFLLKMAQALMVPVALAIVLTFVLATPVRVMRSRGIPEVYGALVLVLALIGVVGMLLSTVIGPATQWWERAPTTLDQLVVQFDRLRASIPILAPPEPAPAVERQRPPPAPSDPLKERIASESLALTGAVIGRIVSFSISAAAMVILLYFLLSSEHWMLARTVEAIPRRRARAQLLIGIRNAQREIGRFLGTLTLINTGVGIVTGLAMTAIGLPNPVLWGTVAAVLNFIPYIGPIIIAGMLLLAGVASFDSSGLILAPAGAWVVIHAIESNLVSPWLMGRRLALSRVSIFLSVMFWGWLWGIVGAMIAVPVLVGLRSACRYDRRLRWLGVYLQADTVVAPSLRSLLR